VAHLRAKTRRARGPRTTPLSPASLRGIGAGELDSQRSGAEMGDGRGGIASSPDLTAKMAFSWL